MRLDDERKQDLLRKLSRKIGEKNVSPFMSVLERDRQFVNALNTEVGAQLLHDAISNAEDIIALYIDGNDKPEDRSRLQAYIAIIQKWQGIINRYDKNRAQFMKITKDE